MKNFLKGIVIKIITWEAKLVLHKTQAKIIAITGNLGKTSTKDFVYAVLKNNLIDKTGHSLVVASPKSMNSEFGVPLTILQLKTGWNSWVDWLKIIFQGLFKVLDKNPYKYYVLEIGAGAPGDILELTKYIKPDIAILTAFAKIPVHIEFFDNDREQLIREKKYLFEALKSGGTMIYNLDDEDCVRVADELKDKDVKFQTFSLTNSIADAYISKIDLLYKEINKVAKQLVGSIATVNIENEVKDITLTGVVGQGILASLLPSLLVAKEFNITLEKASQDINSAERTRGRMRVLPGIYNSTIIDDTYNASPKATENGIELIRQTETNGKKILILGDMLELGEYTRSEHERIGSLVAPVADILITGGVRAKMIGEAAIANGLDKNKVFITKNSEAAGKQLLKILDSEVENDYREGKKENEIGGDIIYVKGSQGARMERVAKMILDRKYHKPEDVLVRQEKAWKER